MNMRRQRTKSERCLSESKSCPISNIKITEKGTTGKQYWVKAVDPNSNQHTEYKLTIDNENTWNLIEEDQEFHPLKY
jgi:hypothetical protein